MARIGELVLGWVCMRSGFGLLGRFPVWVWLFTGFGWVMPSICGWIRMATVGFAGLGGLI